MHSVAGNNNPSHLLLSVRILSDEHETLQEVIHEIGRLKLEVARLMLMQYTNSATRPLFRAKRGRPEQRMIPTAPAPTAAMSCSPCHEMPASVVDQALDVVTMPPDLYCRAFLQNSEVWGLLPVNLADGIFLDCNDPFARNLNLNREAILRRPIAELAQNYLPIASWVIGLLSLHGTVQSCNLAIPNLGVMQDLVWTLEYDDELDRSIAPHRRRRIPARVQVLGICTRPLMLNAPPLQVITIDGRQSWQFPMHLLEAPVDSGDASSMNAMTISEAVRAVASAAGDKLFASGSATTSGVHNCSSSQSDGRAGPVALRPEVLAALDKVMFNPIDESPSASAPASLQASLDVIHHADRLISVRSPCPSLPSSMEH